MDRPALARAALSESVRLRLDTNVGVESPLDVYALCATCDVPVRFVDIDMEGMYRRTPTPRIIVSALRPLARRNFTCGHELGHHVFGHGSTIDGLLGESSLRPPRSSAEFLAEAFAGFLLMPPLGVRRAYADRGWDLQRVDPEQHYAVACSFGVGYTTLLSHLCAGLRTLSRERFNELNRASPRTIRATILGERATAPLLVVDRHWRLPTIDLEVGTDLLLPTGTTVEGPNLVKVGDVAPGHLFRATRPGLARACGDFDERAKFIRIARFQYVGLSQYRHLEEAEPDDQPA